MNEIELLQAILNTTKQISNYLHYLPMYLGIIAGILVAKLILKK